MITMDARPFMRGLDQALKGVEDMIRWFKKGLFGRVKEYAFGDIGQSCPAWVAADIHKWKHTHCRECGKMIIQNRDQFIQLRDGECCCAQCWRGEV